MEHKKLCKFYNSETIYENSDINISLINNEIIINTWNGSDKYLIKYCPECGNKLNNKELI